MESVKGKGRAGESESEYGRREGLRQAGGGEVHAVTSPCLQHSVAHGACMCPSHGPACCRKPQPLSRER